MARLGGPLYALRLLGYVLFRPIATTANLAAGFVDQAVLGRSPLNPKE